MIRVGDSAQVVVVPKPNITKAERAALRNLQKDDTIIVLPADTGRATVLMNTDDYKTKITALVSDTQHLQ